MIVSNNTVCPWLTSYCTSRLYSKRVHFVFHVLYLLYLHPTLMPSTVAGRCDQACSTVFAFFVQPDGDHRHRGSAHQAACCPVDALWGYLSALSKMLPHFLFLSPSSHTSMLNPLLTLGIWSFHKTLECVDWHISDIGRIWLLGTSIKFRLK